MLSELVTIACYSIGSTSQSIHLIRWHSRQISIQYICKHSIKLQFWYYWNDPIDWLIWIKIVKKKTTNATIWIHRFIIKAIVKQAFILSHIHEIHCVLCQNPLGRIRLHNMGPRSRVPHHAQRVCHSLFSILSNIWLKSLMVGKMVGKIMILIKIFLRFYRIDDIWDTFDANLSQYFEFFQQSIPFYCMLGTFQTFLFSQALTLK